MESFGKIVEEDGPILFTLVICLCRVPFCFHGIIFIDVLFIAFSAYGLLKQEHLAQEKQADDAWLFERRK